MSLERLWYHGPAVTSVLVDLVLLVVAVLAYRRFHLASLIFLMMAFGLFLLGSCYAYGLALMEMGLIPWDWNLPGASIAYVGGSLIQCAANILLAVGGVALAKHAFRQQDKDYIPEEPKE